MDDPLTEQEKWRRAKRWVEEHSGAYTWRVLSVSKEGFQYDGPGFFSPRFLRWEEAYRFKERSKP